MAHPFVGAGMGTYDMIHATYSLLMHVPFIGHAHNLYIDIAIAQGGVALLVFVCMMAQFFALSLGKSPRIRVFAAPVGDTVFAAARLCRQRHLFEWSAVDYVCAVCVFGQGAACVCSSQ